MNYNDFYRDYLTEIGKIQISVNSIVSKEE
jgi:hypothetical protein